MLFEKQGLSLNSLTVILVEDDETLRQLTADIITELGGECQTFETADDALIRMLKTDGECSLVIADHGVPGEIQGAEFLTMVNARWPTIPTILTSGYRLEVGHKRPSSEYLFKPLSLDELIESMKFALASRSDL